MVFITVGSQKFPFNRLLKMIDQLIEEGVITEEVTAQTGASDYVPQHYSHQAFMDREEYARKTEQCDVFITHGGTGAIIGAVKKGKKVIAVPRLAKYGEHVDDHQIQLLKEFEGMGMIQVCYEVEKLGEAYGQLKDVAMNPYYSNTEKIIENLEKFLGSMQ